VDNYLALGMAVLVVLLVLALISTFFLRHLTRRSASLRRLLVLADRLEADLKACRSRLQQAHAVMSLNPDLPAASEQEANQAIDAGLRALLQQRIWIRDVAPRASLRELNEAGVSMDQARERLVPLLQALGQAQRELDSAMREHIRQEPFA
jgi:hypothetical protein